MQPTATHDRRARTHVCNRYHHDGWVWRYERNYIIYILSGSARYERGLALLRDVVRQDRRADERMRRKLRSRYIYIYIQMYTWNI